MIYTLLIQIKLGLFGLFYSEKSKKACDEILHNSNLYYKSLSSKNKKHFQIRTLVYLSNTNFDTEEDFELDLYKKVLISSAFAQITFGLNLFSFKWFNQVFVAPRAYSYRNSGDLYDGDVNLMTKKMNLSWPAVENGFKIPDDALNLSIHELGHCLFFENLKRPYGNKIFRERDITGWRKQAFKKIEKILRNENVVLRDYASTNFVELFSVSLEAFFEQENHFKLNEPNLYSCIVKMLRQDPTNKNNPLHL